MTKEEIEKLTDYVYTMELQNCNRLNDIEMFEEGIKQGITYVSVRLKEQLKAKEEENELIWMLLPKWVKEVPKGLESTFYGTLTYEGDLKIHNIVKKLLNK